jgi:hypothetical protein
MKIEGIIWFRDVVDKLIFKHHVETNEVEQMLEGNPRFRFVEKGERKGEEAICKKVNIKPCLILNLLMNW